VKADLLKKLVERNAKMQENLLSESLLMLRASEKVMFRK